MSKGGIYIPYRLKTSDANLVYWLDTSGTPFTDPFFDETILKCMSRNTGMHRYRSISSPDFMIELAGDIKDVRVSGFIFHVSRCGSTLLSQLLGLDEQNIVLAEVPFFDDILRNPKMTLAKKGRCLRAALKWYGQNRNGISKQLFVKLDSWLVRYWPLIRELWPDVPFFLLYRDPLEVCYSHQKNPGMHAVSGVLEPELFGLTTTGHYDGMETYLNQVLDFYFSTFLTMSDNDKKSVLMSYHRGVIEMLETIVSHTGFKPGEPFWQECRHRLQFHSKDKSRIFHETFPSVNPEEDFKESLANFHRLENRRKAQASHL